MGDTSGTSGNNAGTEDQSVFETSMHWSPPKQARHKRNLDAVDTDSESETTSEEEGGEDSRSAKGEKGELAGASIRLLEIEPAGAAANEPAPEAAWQVGGYSTTREGTRSDCWSPAPTAQSEPEGGTAGRPVSQPAQQGGEEERGSQRARGGWEQTALNGRHSSPRGKNSKPGEKHGRGGKAQRRCKDNEAHIDSELDCGRGIPSGMTLPPLGGYAPTEVIPKTQLVQMNSKGNMYKAILASIGLDSPTTSQENRNNYGDGEQNQGKEIHMGNTPVSNSVSSLIALGQLVLTPGQGKIWEGRNKSPLRRQWETKK